MLVFEYSVCSVSCGFHVLEREREREKVVGVEGAETGYEGDDDINRNRDMKEKRRKTGLGERERWDPNRLQAK